MPLYSSLVATAGSATANSYATVAESDDYHDSIVPAFAEDWTNADATEKAASLMWATRLLDRNVTWSGDRVDATQRLEWPRGNVYDAYGTELATDEIPQFLIEATSELARRLLVKDLTKEPVRGYKRVKVDTIEVEFDYNNPRLIPDAVRAMIAPHGTVKAGGSIARLVRT